MIFKATIEVFVDVESDAEAADAISETMREHLRRYAPLSCVVDWNYAPSSFPLKPATAAEIDALEE
jgi:hypothetical protein